MSELSLPSKIVNGAVAGIAGVTCIFPIDLVKTRLQNQQIIDGRRMYKNIFDCFFKVLRAEGLRGLYSGYGVNVALITPEKSLKLVGNDLFRYLLRKEDGKLPLYRQLLAGAGAGLLQVIATTPMELLKIQLQDAGRKVAKRQLNTAVEGLAAGAGSVSLTGVEITRNLVRSQGIFGLYRGLGATLARDIPFSVVYFPLFAYLNEKGYKDGSERASFTHSFASGVVAACIAAVVVNPMDVIKTRLQLLEHAEGDQTYTGIRDCFSKIWKSEGPSAFLKGASARVLVIGPLFGIAQGVYFLGVGEFMIDHGRRVWGV